jgi:ribonuclease P protein component
LRRSAQFEHLLRDGTRRNIGGYTFYFERRAGGAPRLGMLVTRKHAAAATQRNYIKRCIREAFRLEQHRLGPVDILVRPPYGASPSPEMIRRLRELMAVVAA